MDNKQAKNKNFCIIPGLLINKKFTIHDDALKMHFIEINLLES